MEIEVALAKVGRHGAVDSGDSFEMVERPRGGLSFVLADGRGSGGRAKFVSNLVARKAIALLGEGVRDEAAARAAHDFLFHYRAGRASATLNIVSLHRGRRVIAVARNSPVPVVVVRPEGIEVLDDPAAPIGAHEATEPVVRELSIDGDLYLVVATDGLTSAGREHGRALDLRRAVADFFEIGGHGAERLADALLAQALALDLGRPADDISVLVVAVGAGEAPDAVRRLVVRAPV
jgi:serine phosphatase RsbU (regulator of sigma subunit)